MGSIPRQGTEIPYATQRGQKIKKKKKKKLFLKPLSPVLGFGSYLMRAAPVH